MYMQHSIVMESVQFKKMILQDYSFKYGDSQKWCTCDIHGYTEHQYPFIRAICWKEVGDSGCKPG